MRERGRRRTFYTEPQGNRATVALFVGALVLLLISGALVVAMVRRGAAATPTPTQQIIAIAVTPTPDATSTASPAAPSPTTTTRAGTATATVRPATATASRVASAPASPTLRPATVRAGGCAVALPPGFTEEKPGGGYYPAADRTGFAALDPFDTAGGQRSPSDVSQAYVEGVLRQALEDYRQTATTPTADGARIEFTARANGKPGRGIVTVRRVGEIACGVTLFALSDSPIAFDQALDYLLSSLQPARP